MMPSHERHYRIHLAFTVVELLVTIAIIAVLIGLLLPAIQFGREASRRSACSNNLRQIGLALLSYESGARSLPCGARRQYGFGISWWVAIAPHLEESVILGRFDFVSANNGSTLLNAQNGLLANRVVIEPLLCPSSPLPRFWPIGSIEIMMPSCVGISGSSSHNGFRESRVSPCCVPSSNGEISAGGMLIPNEVVRIRQVTDGVAHTLAVGECSDYAVDSAGTQRRIDGGFPNGWITGTSAPGTPPNYGTTFAPPSWNLTTVRYPPNMRDYNQPGVHQNRGANNPLLSAHSEGVNALLLSGAVLFLTNGIELTTLKALATRDDATMIPQ